MFEPRVGLLIGWVLKIAGQGERSTWLQRHFCPAWSLALLPGRLIHEASRQLSGETDEFSAYLLAPVNGLTKRHYGDINLQWDTVNTPFSTLIRGKPERLHIARVSPRRTVRFLSPGQTGGQPRDFQQAEIKVTDSPVTASIVFNTRHGRCQSRWIEIHLDHENAPTVRIGGSEPC